MDAQVVAVLLSILLYVVFVLLPLVPAVIIYRTFPKTKVAVKGPLGNLGINASGAFAAYVTVGVLGFFLIRSTQELIAGLTRQTVVVTSEVDLVDASGRPLSEEEADELDNLLQVKVIPPYDLTRLKAVRVTLPAQHVAAALLQYSLDGFTTAEVRLADHAVGSPGKIDLGRVRLRRVVQPYQPALAAFPRLQEVPATLLPADTVPAGAAPGGEGAP